MLDMVRILDVPPGARILDMGGTDYVWNLFENDFHVTLVNLPGSVRNLRSSQFEYIDGDACDLSREFDDNQFDVVFSNSVIEHVGPQDRQRLFAAEAIRLGRCYWVQTPSTRSPIEPHTCMPFYWQLRRVLGKAPVRKGTRVLSQREMEELFPGGEVYRERLFGIEKSYAMYRRVTTD